MAQGLSTPSGPSRVDRPMRVLALHGGGANSVLQRTQMKGLQKIVGDGAEWDFMDGGITYNMEGLSYGDPRFELGGSVVNPSDMEKALSKDEPFRGWYVSKCHQPSDERHWLTKLCDRSVRYEYDEQAEENAEKVLKYIAANGPFDVLLGFSQATALVHIITGLLRERGQEVPWKLSVLFSPFPVRDSRFFRLFQTPLSHPAVICFGKSDWGYHYGMTAWRVHEWYERPVVFEHEGGHQIPDFKSKEFLASVAEEMWKHCGAEGKHCDFWEVVGDKGALVRADCKVPSDEKGRLCRGAVVRQLALEGERLSYQKLLRTGPDFGWVSIALLTKEGTKPLLAKVERQPPVVHAPSGMSLSELLPVDSNQVS